MNLLVLLYLTKIISIYLRTFILNPLLKPRDGIYVVANMKLLGHNIFSGVFVYQSIEHTVNIRELELLLVNMNLLAHNISC
jgi:hypothetical protein